ncbi:MAG: alpha/beta hydrolase family protein [Chloroflexota bacterium]
MNPSILSLTPPTTGTRIAYGSADRQQFGDLRLPEGAGPFPLAVYIHGGFWRARYDLTHAGNVCSALTAAGLATWNIEYRRIGNGGGWPATFNDVEAGADFVTTLAISHPIDLTRVLTCGHSAGGQLALWLAARRNIKAAERPHSLSSLALVAAVSLAGVVDLHRSWQLGLGGGAVTELLGGSPETYPERYADASPAALLPLGIPQTLIHGAEDDTVPCSMSEEYASRAIQHGDSATMERLEGAGHFDLVDPRSAHWPRAERTIVKLLSGAE